MRGLIEGDMGLRGRQGLGESMWVTEYICERRKEKEWVGYAGAEAGGRQPKLKRSRGEVATVE